MRIPRSPRQARFEEALRRAAKMLDADRLVAATDAAYDALAIAEDIGPESEQAFEALSALTDIAGATGDARTAEPFALRRAELGTLIWGDDDSRTAQALFELAVIERVLGKDREAEPILRRLEAVSPEPDENRAMVLGALGDVLVARDEFIEAEKFLSEAVRIVFDANAITDSEALEPVWSLTSLLRLLDRPRESAEIARATLDAMDRTDGVERMDRALALNALALAAGDLERFAEARSAADEAVALALAADAEGPDPRALTLLENLGDHFEDTGDLASADQTWQRAIGLSESLFGRNDARHARTLGEWAARLYRRGNAEAADAPMRRALSILEADRAADPDELGVAYNRMAGIASDLGRFGQAEKAQRKALALAEQVYGPADVSVAVCLANLGRILIDVGESGEAVETLERAIGIVRDDPDAAPSEFVIPYLRLGEALLAADRTDEALSAFRDSISYAETGGDVFTHDAGEAYFLAGVAAIGLEEFEEASRRLESALDIRQAVLGESAPETVNAADMLAIALRGAGRYEEAEAVARRALDVIDASENPEARYTEILGTLGSILMLEERLDEALEVLTRAVDAANEDTDPEALGWARDALGSVLVDEERYDEAELVFGRNLGFPEDDPSLIEIRMSALAGLGAVARHTGRYNEAESLLREAIEIHESLRGDDDPELAFGYGRLAEVLDALGRREERDAACARARVLATQLDPHDEDVRELLERLDDLR